MGRLITKDALKRVGAILAILGGMAMLISMLWSEGAYSDSFSLVAEAGIGAAIVGGLLYVISWKSSFASAKLKAEKAEKDSGRQALAAIQIAVIFLSAFVGLYLLLIDTWLSSERAFSGLPVFVLAALIWMSSYAFSVLLLAFAALGIAWIVFTLSRRRRRNV